METEEDGTPDRRRPNKVVRLIEEYDLDGLGDELERKWTAEGDDRYSLRELADEFNRRLLERTLQAAGLQSLSGTEENIYRLLTDDDVSDADRIRVRRRLERNDIDVDALQRDFVSYQSIRTYLTEYRDASYQSESDPVEQAASTIGPLRSRLATVTESKLEAARGDGEFELGEFDVTVDVRVICRDCGSQHEVGALLDRGGCDCS